MRLICHKTTTKVAGDARANNEDAFLPKARRRESIRRFAMCDGATSSYAARVWAQLLAGAFAAEGEQSERERVYSAAKHYEVRFPATALAGLDHSTIEAFKRGSSATLLLLEQAEDDGEVRATAVGDTCLFLMDSDYRICDAFPMSDASSFSTSAYLITVTFDGLKSLFADDTKDLYWKAKTLSPEACAGKRIVCATDAVAQWIALHKDVPCEIERLVKAVRHSNKKKFSHFVEFERRRGRMAVDDSTVVILEV